MANKKKDHTDSRTTHVAGPDVDQGYAWVTLVGCFIAYWLIIGTVKSYGILYTKMVSHYRTGSGNTAWIGSLILLLMLGMSPVSNLLSKTFSFRRVTFAGGVLMGVGYFLSGFVPQMEILYVTLGLCAGLGYGFAFAPVSTIISFYFDKHRALANGIMVSGSGLGALTHPFIYRYLVDSYGLQGAFWILGAFLSNVCVAACLLKQPTFLVKEPKRIKAETDGNEAKVTLLNSTNVRLVQETTNSNICDRLDFRIALFKNPRFTMYCVAFILCMNGYGNCLILIPAQIKALGYDDMHAAYGVNIMGVCEVCARLFFGWLADQECIEKKHIFLMSMFCGCVISFLAPFFTSFLFMAIHAAVIGTFPGSFWSLLSVLIIDVVGIDDFNSAYGLIMLCLAVGAVVSQPCIGWLEDYTGNWHASFILNACLFLTGGLIVSMEPIILRYFMNTVPKNEHKLVNAKHPSKQTIQPEEQDETGSLLESDVAEVSFTSARISRIYRPYNWDKPARYRSSSPAPIVDKMNV